METSEKQTLSIDEARITSLIKSKKIWRHKQLDEVAQCIGTLSGDVKIVAATTTRQGLNKLEQSNVEIMRWLAKDDN